MSMNDNGQGWDKLSPVRHVAQVMQKLEAGVYPTEETKCFCGIEPSRDSILAERDRYTMPHRMVLCENCLLVRANPRMTREAYREFYNNEYRKIYDGFSDGPQSEDPDFLFEKAHKKGRDLKEFLLQFEIDPKIVVDIGSDKGGMMMSFKDGGATVYGVEICAEGRTYTEAKGLTIFSSIEELIERGIKADLVVMQDVIEHLVDLTEVEKIQHILAPNGKLFIFTPGLLATNPAMLFQNAHTYQFIAATLEAIMERMGYAEEFLDDHIISIWKYIGPPQFEPEWPIAWRAAIFEHLLQSDKRSLPPVRARCKFSEKSMLKNIDGNLTLQIPMMGDLIGKYSGPCVIVAGGPSVDGQIEKIKELVADGAALIVIERMYPWCYKHGLKPTFVTQLDASEGVTDGFTHINPDTIHLIAATTHPSVFEILKGYKQYIWCGVGGTHPDAQDFLHKNGYTRNVIVNTGGSVALASLSLGEVLGYRDFHLFGFDCMVPSHDKTYAAHVAGESVDRSYVEVEVGGETVLTCSSFLAFAQQFFTMTATAWRWGLIDRVQIYGESLITKMFDGGNDNFFNPKQTELSVGA